MANVVDTLVTRYVLDDSNYKQGADSVLRSTMQLSGPLSSLITKMRSLGPALAGVSGPALLVAGVMLKLSVAIGGVKAVTEAAIAAARETIPAFAEFDALNMSLKAIEGSSKNAEKALRAMQTAARMPGLGLEQATQGYLRLRQSGMNPAQAQRVIETAGNANALVGGGKEELGRLLLAFSQMFGKRKVSGEELMQMTEAGLPAQSLLINKYGTADADELKKKGVTFDQVMETLLTAMEAMPKASGGVKNTLENITMALDKMKSDIGGGIWGQIGGDFAQLGTVLSNIADSGVLSVIGDAFGGVLNALNPFAGEMDGLTGIILDAVAATAGLIDTVAAFHQVWVSIGKALMDSPILKFFAKVAGVALQAASPDNMFASMNISENIDRRRAEVYAKYAKYQKASAGKQDPLAGDPSFLSSSSASAPLDPPALPYLSEIAQNTRKMADLQAQLLGGGNQKLTAHELAGIGNSANSAMNKIMEGVAEMMRLTIAQDRSLGRVR